MQDDLEAKMNEMLSGKFFWEPTADLEDCRIPEVIDIRQAQKRMSRPEGKTYSLRSSKGDPTGIDSVKNVMYLAEQIAIVHGCATSDLIEKSRDRTFSLPKQHYSWSLMRYYPTLSASQLAKLIDREHSTIIRSAQRFELVMDKYKDQIRSVDRAMWIGYSNE